MLRLLFFYALLGATAAYALRRGGPSERATAVILTGSVAMTLMVRVSGLGRYEQFQTGIFLTDLAMFLLLLTVALLATRWWPLWMAGFAGATVVSHVVRLSPMVNSFAYYALIAFWMYPMLALLVVATWRTGRRHPSAPGARGALS